jgi:hypothetical protein
MCFVIWIGPRGGSAIAAPAPFRPCSFAPLSLRSAGCDENGLADINVVLELVSDEDRNVGAAGGEGPRLVAPARRYSLAPGVW